MADDLRAALRERIKRAIPEKVVTWPTPYDRRYGLLDETDRIMIAQSVLALLDDWVPRAEHKAGESHPDHLATALLASEEEVDRLQRGIAAQHRNLRGAQAEAKRQTDNARRYKADLVALLEGMEVAGWEWKYDETFAKQQSLRNPLRPFVNGLGMWSDSEPVYLDRHPVYRLSPSAASLHAGLTGAVTGPSAPAAPVEVADA